MKNANAKKMALYIAIITAAIMLSMEMLFIFTGMQRSLPVTASAILLVFAAVYMLVYLLLGDFIVQKINPLFKTIHNLKLAEKDLREELSESEMIEDLNKEVEDWASGKTKEIDQLREMESYRKEFLGNVSHELKTPIFNVQGYVNTLLEGGIDDPSVNRKYLERADKSISRLINIVNDLAIISGLDTGEVKLNFENFDIVQLSREVIELQEMTAGKHGIKLMLKNDLSQVITVHADRKRIQEAMVNLVINSAKYGRENGVTTIELVEMEDNVMVEVADNGLGIANEELTRIFERFYRVEKTRSRNEGGTGLGLAIVKHIIDAHNQSINVRSIEGEGSSFTFSLMKGR
jgi:two-component system, OmpR family, phosphate regulon sensor histidine kinase PhoR